MFSRKRFSIKDEVFYVGVLSSLLILLVFGCLMFTSLFAINVDNAKQSLAETNMQISVFTEGFFRELINTINALADNADIRNILLGDEETKERALSTYRSISKANKNILYVYSGYEDGLLLINDYEPPAGFDPRQRPWYRAALDKKPEISKGVPFREANSGEWVVAPSKALIDKEGNFTGVIAIDISLASITDLLGERHLYDSQRSFIMDQTGMIVVHPEENLIGQTIPAMKENITDRQGELAYTADGKKKWAYYSTIDSTDWIFLTDVERGEILNPIIAKMVLFSVCIIVLVIALGIMQSKILGKRFAEPLSELGRRIAAITTAGEPIDGASYEYSNQEIAEIAGNIEKLAGHSLNKKANELKTIIESTDDGILVVNKQKEVIYVNSRFLEMWRIPDEVKTKKEDSAFLTVALKQLVDPESFLVKVQELYKSNQTDTDIIEFKDGRIYERFSQPLIDNEQVVGRLWSFRDITTRKKMEELLFREKELFKTTLLSVGDGVISTNFKGNVMIMNRVAEELTGWTQKEALGKPMVEVFNIINEFTKEKCENPVYEVLKTGSPIQLPDDTVLIMKDGRELAITDSAAPIRDKDGKVTGAVLVFRDFSKQKKEQAHIEYLSFHDALTDLYNRRFFEEELKRLDTERNLPLSLIVLDVNGLKMVNDAFGHKAGDRLLQKVAAIMKSECRSDDIIARISGNEFVILLPKTDSQQVETIVNRIGDALRHEKVESMEVSVAIGWETKGDAKEDISEVYKKAENSMYQKKISDRSSTRHKAIKVIMKTLYEKIPREEEHSNRVSELCCKIGTALNLSNTEVRELKVAGLLHDIGKIAVSNEILNKVEVLNVSDWTEIKRHPEVGYSILSAVNDYASLAVDILSHHERWDGSGYPKGLQGEEISLPSRIIAVADAYDAMTSFRPYKRALSKEKAVEEIVKHAGTQFDPQVVNVFLNKVIAK